MFRWLVRWVLGGWVWLLLGIPLAHAAPELVQGQWHLVAPRATDEAPAWLAGWDAAVARPVVASQPRTGGHYVFTGELNVPRGGRWVLDFTNSTVVGDFRHRVFAPNGHEVALLEGGLNWARRNPYAGRHGRVVALEAGRYRLLTEVASPFQVQHVDVYLDDEPSYQLGIQPGNWVAAAAQGLMLCVAVFYAMLGLSRRRPTELLYSAFVLLSALYGMSALLTLHDLFGIRGMALTGTAVLVSNIVYLLFVNSLLGISAASHTKLVWVSRAALAVLGLLAAVGLAAPHWRMVLQVQGINVALTYALIAVVVECRARNPIAYRYSIALGLFFVLTMGTIHVSRMPGVYTWVIEHIGLLCWACEILALNWVLTFQFAQLIKEREAALSQLAVTEKVALTDELTQLPNRYALLQAAQPATPETSLTIIDLDGLKHYNDSEGHARGDALLARFAGCLRGALGKGETAYRLGGDEFAVLSPQGDSASVVTAIGQAVAALRAEGFSLAGASAGSAARAEVSTVSDWMALSDARMYTDKAARRRP